MRVKCNWRNALRRKPLNYKTFTPLHKLKFISLRLCFIIKYFTPYCYNICFIHSIPSTSIKLNWKKWNDSAMKELNWWRMKCISINCLKWVITVVMSQYISFFYLKAAASAILSGNQRKLMEREERIELLALRYTFHNN